MFQVKFLPITRQLAVNGQRRKLTIIRQYFLINSKLKKKQNALITKNYKKMETSGKIKEQKLGVFSENIRYLENTSKIKKNKFEEFLRQ